MRRAAFFALLAAAACDVRPAEERALAELEVGVGHSARVDLTVEGGLAAVRALVDDAAAGVTRAELWAQAPVLALSVDARAAVTLALTVHNALPDAELGSVGAPLAIAPGPVAVRPTTRTFVITLAGRAARARAGARRRRARRPTGSAMADIQTALPTVDEVFARIAAVPDVRFVVSMGDLTDRGEVAEYDLFEAQLAALPVPYYTTLGNHELWADPARYRDRFGRSSFQFEYRGVAFTFADSGDAGLDPLVHGWIDAWLAVAHDRLHLLMTHFPPIEPSGARAGAFRSRHEAMDLLARMAAGGVDLALYGHIHTLMTYEHAGIPAWISGGGGATQERWDGIGRHFLVVDLDPGTRTADVGVVRVDP
ncbi:MAG: metallophosphoesterase [Kofleriaceae bacterium]